MNTFKVFSNPWAAIDHKARPSGAVLMDPVEHNPQGGKYVGAKLKAVQTSPRQTRKVGRYTEVLQEAAHDRIWEFSRAPADIPSVRGGVSDYYRDRIRTNDLIPADEACATAAGVKFIDPALVIASSRAKRKSEWDAQHGVGSFDSLQPIGETKQPEKTDSDQSTPTATEPQAISGTTPPEKAVAASKEAKQLTAAPKRAETSKE